MATALPRRGENAARPIGKQDVGIFRVKPEPRSEQAFGRLFDPFRGLKGQALTDQCEISSDREERVFHSFRNQGRAFAPLALVLQPAANPNIGGSQDSKAAESRCQRQQQREHAAK